MTAEAGERGGAVTCDGRLFHRYTYNGCICYYF